ncbi:MAG: 2-octaprenyl-6-methoxyphenyl hydroxylase [Methylococcales bacterium]|nr:2-octaprenyl-6-methoxyphenyl hydroxylase [Methylococcales bacterium]
MQYDYDLLIVGGGLAGNCLALALKNTSLRIAIIEANTREQLHAKPAGDRALALASGTVMMLEKLNSWQGISHAATPIKHIHISDRGHFGKTRLSAQKEHVDALGYVISARDLETYVADQVLKAGIELISPARVMGLMSGDKEICVSLKQGNNILNLSARLLVGADGGLSSVRQLLNIGQHTTEYGQTAIVTTVQSSLPHKNTAYERFTASGPLALLPIARNQCAVVWTRSTEDANALMLGSEVDFLAELQQCFGFKLGELSLSAPRRAFPLSLIRAETMVTGRALIIGNAAHQLHPVAGQGFNLGLRDVVQLAERLIKQSSLNSDIGDANFLNEYAISRKKDHDRTIGFTDAVVKIFSNEWLALALARNIGLTLLDHIPVAKTLLTRHAMGLEGK